MSIADKQAAQAEIAFTEYDFGDGVTVTVSVRVIGLFIQRRENAPLFSLVSRRLMPKVDVEEACRRRFDRRFSRRN